MTAISDASDGFLGVALALDMTFIDRNGPKEASVSNSLLLTAMRCLVGAVAALPLAVSADVFRVGQTGAACTHRNIQAAINAADANPGADEIRITRDVSTSGEPYWLTNGLTIDTDDALTFSGGWNDCDDEDWQAGFDYQDISGNGFGKPVLQIRGSGEIVLAGLGVTLGEAPAQGTPRAGGIDFEGTGSLYIYTTRIFANTGRLGGGLRVANGQVTLAVNTYIYGNTAITGGGVYIGNNGRLKMEGPYAFITGNVADFGGGLGVFGSGTADLVASDSSLALSGPISGNHATEAGGAISIQTSGAEQQAVVRIASSDPTRVFALTDNSAYRAGAIYVAGGTGGARFCGRNINVSHNISQVGASLMADGPAASIQMGRDLCADLPTPNVECAPQGETRCNRIHENSSGADLLIADSGAQILLSRMRVDHNIVGGAVVNSLTGSPSLSSNITNESSLYDHNNAALLFYAGPYSRVTSVHNTVADNIVSPSAHSFYVMEGAALLGGWDVIDQPQALMFVDAAAASVALQTVMAPNAIGAPPGTVLQTTPIFAGGNTYRLDSSSPGIDYADPALGGQVDIDGANRNVDHPLRGNVFGANDLGAFETQDVVGAPGLIFADGMEEVPPFENNVAVAIPDNTLAGVESSIQVGLIAPVAPSVRVYVRIDHTFIGDLVVDLISPRGDVHNLHNRTGGSANNIDTEFVVTNTPELPNGTWRLRVSDRASLDTGTLVRWRLTF